MPWQVLEDQRLLATLIKDPRSTCCTDSSRPVRALRRLVEVEARPERSTRCCAAMPMDFASHRSATDRHRRVGTRERLLDVAARHPDRLRIELNALATRVLFDADNRAIGVEYLKGEHLYRAIRDAVR